MSCRIKNFKHIRNLIARRFAVIRDNNAAIKIGILCRIVNVRSFNPPTDTQLDRICVLQISPRFHQRFLYQKPCMFAVTVVLQIVIQPRLLQPIV